MIRAVFFDVGGTVHTQDATPENDRMYCRMLHDTLLAHGIRTTETPDALLPHIDAGAKAYKAFSETELTEAPGKTVWKDFFLRDFAVTDAQMTDALAEALSFQFDRYRKVIRKREGLEQTLDRLAADGLQLGIISNIMSKTFVPRILEEHGVLDRFSSMVLSSVCGIRKPDRRIFDLALEQTGLGADEVAYIGDTISRDVRGVRAAGWALMIQIDNPRVRGKDKKFDGMGYEPDYHIRSLPEIAPIVEQYRAQQKEGLKGS